MIGYHVFPETTVKPTHKRDMLVLSTTVDPISDIVASHILSLPFADPDYSPNWCSWCGEFAGLLIGTGDDCCDNHYAIYFATHKAAL